MLRVEGHIPRRNGLNGRGHGEQIEIQAGAGNTVYCGLGFTHADCWDGSTSSAGDGSSWSVP